MYTDKSSVPHGLWKSDGTKIETTRYRDRVHYQTKRKRARIYDRIWRSKNPDKVKNWDTSKYWLKKGLNYHILDMIKSESGCIDCGERNILCLDFDHRDSSCKAFMISREIDKSLHRLLSEVEKCDVRCSNCHRKRHA